MTNNIKAIVAALVAASLFGGGWTVHSWKKDSQLKAKDTEIAQIKQQHATQLGSLADQARKVSGLVLHASALNTAAIAAVDAQLIGELDAEKQTNDGLRTCIANRTCGVRIITKRAACPASTGHSAGGIDATPSSLGDDSIGLDAETGLRVLDLRTSIQLDDKKLRYLQAYAKQCAGIEAQNNEVNLHLR